MDLSPRQPAYRGAVVRCPGCGEVMHAEPVPSAEVDVCDRCEGLWIDWFDGDIHVLATEAEAARVDRGTPLPSITNATHVASGGTGACPRCMQKLIPELFRFADARDDELVNGVELLRCTECAGSFVPRGSAHLLLDRVREPRGGSLWEAIVALLRRLVGMEHPS